MSHSFIPFVHVCGFRVTLTVTRNPQTCTNGINESIRAGCRIYFVSTCVFVAVNTSSLIPMTGIMVLPRAALYRLRMLRATDVVHKYATFFPVSATEVNSMHNCNSSSKGMRKKYGSRYAKKNVSSGICGQQRLTSAVAVRICPKTFSHGEAHIINVCCMIHILRRFIFCVDIHPQVVRPLQYSCGNF